MAWGFRSVNKLHASWQLSKFGKIPFEEMVKYTSVEFKFAPKAILCSDLNWVIYGWWHQFGFRLFWFLRNQHNASQYVIYGRLMRIDYSLSLNLNRCHHPLITQLTLIVMIIGDQLKSLQKLPNKSCLHHFLGKMHTVLGMANSNKIDCLVI